MANDLPKQEGLNQVPETREMPKAPEQVAGVEVVEPIQIVPEQGDEQKAEQPSMVSETPREGKMVSTRKSTTVAPAQIDRLEKEIDGILEEDLKELYVAMPPQKQAEFREKGEETRSKIRQLVSSAKVNAKKIFVLIRGWLKIIPGVNRFFLEQEAKIKTDKILLVTEEEKKRSPEL
jgi:hypothetical protein